MKAFSMTSTTSTTSERPTASGTAGWQRRSLLGLALGLTTLPLARPAIAGSTAEAFVASIGDQVVAILREADKSDAEKLAALKTLLDSYTDLDLVARLVLGRHWQTASADERRDYVELFRQILMNTMAERMSDYEGQTFEVIGSNALNERDTAVQTRINRLRGAPPLRVDWRLRQTGDDFAIIDVIAEGVSLVVSQRNEVGSVVERQGMAGLIETMRQRSNTGDTVL
jgi:phospholipid transport system substrate-binding protein